MEPDACGGSTTPVNVATGHRYRGVNLFVLGMSPLALTSGDPRWCSYRQATARGWQVRKGEKATPVYFYKPIEIKDKSEDGDGETRRIPMLRMISVFHASQIDGVLALEPPIATKTVLERVKDVEPIIEASGVPVRIGGDWAFYSPALDVIQLPPDEAFKVRTSARSTACMNSRTRGVIRRDSIAICAAVLDLAFTRKELRAELRTCWSDP